MIPEIRERILSRDPGDWPLPQPMGRLSFMRIGSPRLVPGEGTAAFLCFNGSWPDPILVVKAAKEPRFSESIRAEHANLGKAKAMLGGVGFVRIPDALDLFEVDGCAVLLESFLSGRTFLGNVDVRDGFLIRRRVRRGMDLSARWAAEAGRITLAGAPTVSAEGVREIANRFRATFNATEAERRYLAAIVESVEDLRLPLLPAHGDFFAGNLLYDRGRLGVCDWSSFQERTVPLLDFVTFTTARSLVGMKGPWFAERCVVTGPLRGRTGWYETLLMQSARRACEGLGIPSASLPTIWGLALLAAAVMDRSALGSRPAVAEGFRNHFAQLAALVEKRKHATLPSRGNPSAGSSS